MKKKALLIGISHYKPYFENLPSSVKDVKAIQEVLKDPNIGQFNEEDIIVLVPELEQQVQATSHELSEQEIQDNIYDFFIDKDEDDLLILYFSGHALINNDGNLFFAATDTKKYEYGGNLIESTAIPASFICETMNKSKSKNKVVILDCCFTEVVKNDEDDTINTVNIETELGGEGRTILASSNSVDYPFKEDKELSIYTTTLLEGIETGNADIDKDGWITLEELHEYIKDKLEKIPNMMPQFYSNQEANKIKLAKVNTQSIAEINLTQTFKLYQIELQTQRQVDYTKLRDLLVAQNWREADIETRKVMRLAAGKQENELLNEQNVNQISCLDLSTIDKLWFVASDGRFGFSAQKDVCQHLLNKLDYENECELGKKLGWRVNNNWLIHSQLNFNLRATKGHFPCLGISLVRLPVSVGGIQRIPIFSHLLQRITQCEDLSA